MNQIAEYITLMPEMRIFGFLNQILFYFVKITLIRFKLNLFYFKYLNKMVTLNCSILETSLVRVVLLFSYKPFLLSKKHIYVFQT